jgi:mRNA-degrading endonuclease YafQ of YafQ-DinJ toxin-antitoxin module
VYKLIFTPTYDKLAEKWLKKHPDLQDKYYKTIQLLELNPYHNSLRLHNLDGTMKKFHSVSIDMRQRIIIDLHFEGDTIILLKIGDHSIYKKK